MIKHFVLSQIGNNDDTEIFITLLPSCLSPTQSDNEVYFDMLFGYERTQLKGQKESP